MFSTQRRRLITWIAAAVTSLMLVIGLPFVTSLHGQVAQATTTLRVYAAVSLTEVLQDIENAYNTDHPSAQISFINTLDSSGALLTQIQNPSNESAGIPDIFISAATTQMNTLQSASKLASGWPVTVATNRLVLIKPNTFAAGSPTPSFSGFSTLTNSSVRGIAIGTPTTVPAGNYGKQVLESTTSGCGGNIYNTLLNNNKLVFANNVRDVLSAVENKTLNSQTIDAGIVYTTDKDVSNQVGLVATAAQNCHSAIVYPAAVLSRTTNGTAAASFANYLSSVTAQGKFTDRGFGVP
jgi:molybdate transport system substrate-binding protein